MNGTWIRGAALAMTLAAAGCTGSTGPAGRDGTSGANGTNGRDGASGASSSGLLVGRMMWEGGGKKAAASGVKVTTVPASGEAVTAADGWYAMPVPSGTYQVVFADPRTPANYATKVVDGVVVASGEMKMVFPALSRASPFLVTATGGFAVPAWGIPHEPAGFGTLVTLGVDVAGATGPLTYSWRQVSGPTTVTLSSVTAAAPTFTTGSFADMASSPVVEALELPERAAFVPISNEQAIRMAYLFEVTVSDGRYTATAGVMVPPAMVTQALNVSPIGTLMVANDLTVVPAGWTLTAPAGSAAVLHGADGKNPWLLPDVAGRYTLTNGATSLTFAAGNFADRGADATGCTGCHQGGPQYQAWKGSHHMNYRLTPPVPAEGTDIFHWGLNGGVIPQYQEGCLNCHVVGFAKGATAVNGGFDDVAKQVGWTMPVPDGTDYWSQLDPKLQRLSGVQCESCHGPGGDLGKTGMPRASFKAGACGACHDEEFFHLQPVWWDESGHASAAGADHATVEGYGTAAADCARCHAAQGYVAWLKQRAAGNAGVLAKPDGSAADVAYLTSLGLTRAAVEPITCQACHDPHSTTLRVVGDTGMLAAGFAVSGAGKGALCMTCHNSRKGLHGETLPTTTIGAPHAPTQTDVIAGRNAYFTWVSQPSSHLAVADTCAGCHANSYPSDLPVHVYSTDTNHNHTFRVDLTMCAGCHAAGVDGKGLQAAFDAARQEVLSAMAAELVKAIGAGSATYTVAAEKLADPQPAAVNVTPGAAPATVSVTTFHGQPYLLLGYAADVADPFGTTTHTLAVKLTGVAVGGTPVAAANGVLAKAVWNWLLVNDGSKGLHNPAFVFDVLSRTGQALASSSAL